MYRGEQSYVRKECVRCLTLTREVLGKFTSAEAIFGHRLTLHAGACCGEALLEVASTRRGHVCLGHHFRWISLRNEETLTDGEGSEALRASDILACRNGSGLHGIEGKADASVECFDSSIRGWAIEEFGESVLVQVSVTSPVRRSMNLTNSLANVAPSSARGRRTGIRLVSSAYHLGEGLSWICGGGEAPVPRI